MDPSYRFEYDVVVPKSPFTFFFEEKNLHLLHADSGASRVNKNNSLENEYASCAGVLAAQEAPFPACLGVRCPKLHAKAATEGPGLSALLQVFRNNATSDRWMDGSSSRRWLRSSFS